MWGSGTLADTNHHPTRALPAAFLRIGSVGVAVFAWRLASRAVESIDGFAARTLSRSDATAVPPAAGAR